MIGSILFHMIINIAFIIYALITTGHIKSCEKYNENIMSNVLQWMTISITKLLSAKANGTRIQIKR